MTLIRRYSDIAYINCTYLSATVRVFQQKHPPETGQFVAFENLSLGVPTLKKVFVFNF